MGYKNTIKECIQHSFISVSFVGHYLLLNNPISEIRAPAPYNNGVDTPVDGKSKGVSSSSISRVVSSLDVIS